MDHAASLQTKANLQLLMLLSPVQADAVVHRVGAGVGEGEPILLCSWQRGSAVELLQGKVTVLGVTPRCPRQLLRDMALSFTH